MGENEQGGMLRNVIVLGLIAIIGAAVIFATISLSANAKNANQEAVSQVDKNMPGLTDTNENTNFSWSYSGDEATVTGFANGKSATSLTIPKYHVDNGKKYTVTAIGNASFPGRNVTAVTIPNSVKSIGNAAFANNQITNLTIPDGVTSISDAAFVNNQLTFVSIGTGVQTIGNSSFSSNKMTSVTIPGNVKTVGFSAFSNNKLTKVIIGDGVSSLKYGSFSSNDIKNVSIPSSVTEMDNAFPYFTEIDKH